MSNKLDSNSSDLEIFNRIRKYSICHVSGVHERDNPDTWNIRKNSFQNFSSDQYSSGGLMAKCGS